jgi:hypothetical protein
MHEEFKTSLNAGNALLPLSLGSFVFPACYLRTDRLKIQNYNFVFCFILDIGMELGVSH